MGKFSYGALAAAMVAGICMVFVCVVFFDFCVACNFCISLYGKKMLPKFRLWIVGKNGKLIFL